MTRLIARPRRPVSPIEPAFFRWTLVAAGLLILAAQTGSPTLAQNATTVQLPKYSYFGTDSSVLVPDRGSAALGRMNRAAAGRSEFGVPLLPWKQRAIGSTTSASGTSASVYLHDFEALEAELLGRRPPGESSTGEFSTDARPPATGAAAADRATAATPPATEAPTAGVPATRSAHAPTQAKEAFLPSVAEIRAQRERQRRSRAEEALSLYQRGLLAEESGSRGAARVYYQMAAKRAEGDLKRQIEAASAGLQTTGRKTGVATQSP